MKKILALILALSLCLLAGCRGNGPSTSSTNASNPSTGGTPTSGTNALAGMTLYQIIDAIYEKDPVELSLGNIDVDLSDPYAVQSYLGLDSADQIKEAVASESMFGAQAYSMVLCRVKDAAQAKSVAQAMRDGIDQRKWVCVHADDLKVSVSGDVVMLIMLSSEYADTATAQSLTDAFRKVAGGTLSAEIK